MSDRHFVFIASRNRTSSLSNLAVLRSLSHDLVGDEEPGAAVPPGDARTRSCARCPRPDDGLLQTVHLLPYPRGRRPTTPCASFAEMNGVAVPSPAPLLTMLDLTPLTSRMWLRDCPVLPRGQDGRQIAPGSSFSEVSPATTLPSRCLANAHPTWQTPRVPGSPEPASCKIMTSLPSQHMLQPKIALRGSR